MQHNLRAPSLLKFTHSFIHSADVTHIHSHSSEFVRQYSCLREHSFFFFIETEISKVEHSPHTIFIYLIFFFGLGGHV